MMDIIVLRIKRLLVPPVSFEQSPIPTSEERSLLRIGRSIRPVVPTTEGRVWRGFIPRVAPDSLEVRGSAESREGKVKKSLQLYDDKPCQTPPFIFQPQAWRLTRGVPAGCTCFVVWQLQIDYTTTW